MRAIVEREVLLGALARTAKIAAGNHIVPILRNVKIMAAGAKLAVDATDVEIYAQSIVPAEVEKTGSITVSARLVTELVRRMPEGAQIRLGTNGQEAHLVLETAKSKSKLWTLPAQDWPVRELQPEGAEKFWISARDLRDAFLRAAIAADIDSSFIYGKGVSFAAGEDGLIFCATDGARLAEIRLPLPDGIDSSFNVLVPKQVLMHLEKLLDVKGADAEIAVNASCLSVRVGEETLMTQLITEKFPAYEHLLKVAPTHVLRVEKALLDGACERCGLLDEMKLEKGHARIEVELRLSPGMGEISIANAACGEISEKIELEWSGEPMRTAFNGRYMREILSAIRSDTVEIGITAGHKPLRFSDSESKNATFLLMPMLGRQGAAAG